MYILKQVSLRNWVRTTFIVIKVAYTFLVVSYIQILYCWLFTQNQGTCIFNPLFFNWERLNIFSCNYIFRKAKLALYIFTIIMREMRAKIQEAVFAYVLDMSSN